MRWRPSRDFLVAKFPQQQAIATGALSQGNFVRVSQGPAMCSTKARPQISRTAAKDGLHIDSARHRNPCATTKLRRLDHQFFISTCERRVTCRKHPRTYPRGEITAAPRDHTLIVETHVQTAERNLQPGGVFIIANQQICQAQAEWIKRTAQRNSEPTESRPAKILNSRNKATADDGRVHALRASNSSRLIDRKRT
jgi:hypothetical protein